MSSRARKGAIIIIFNPVRCMRGETFRTISNAHNPRTFRFIIKELPNKKAVRENLSGK